MVLVLHGNRGITAVVERPGVMSGWNLPLVGMRSWLNIRARRVWDWVSNTCIHARTHTMDYKGSCGRTIAAMYVWSNISWGFVGVLAESIPARVQIKAKTRQTKYTEIHANISKIQPTFHSGCRPLLNMEGKSGVNWSEYILIYPY